MTQNWKEFIDHFPITNPSAKMLVDLRMYGVIKVSGPDAGKFLQGQLSCDVLALQNDEQTLGAYCNIKGKVESLFRLWLKGEDYYLRLQNGLVQPTMLELQKYAIFSKVEIQNVSDQIRGFGIANHTLDIQVEDPDLTQLQITSHQRYEIFGPIKALQHAWQECIKHANHVDPQIWQLLDIETHIPEIYPQTVGTFFPHDLNLPKLGAVSFTKGCFRGQEIVARMQNRGNIKRHLHWFASTQASAETSTENNFQSGDVVTADGPEQENAAGIVVRCCVNKDNVTIGLAVISDIYNTHALSVNNSAILLTPQ